MSRISSLAATTVSITQMLKLQKTLYDDQYKVNFEQNSPDYAGIDTQSQRLVNLENTQSALENYVGQNTVVDTRLSIMEVSLTSVQKTISDFQTNLNTYATGLSKTSVNIGDIQAKAFDSLKALEGYLNTEADGQYLLSGSKLLDAPVDFGLTTLANFQAKYDGATVKVPTSREAHIDDFSFGTDLNSTSADWLSFERRNATSGLSRITAATAQFANMTAGTTITISNTAGVNDGTYEVSAVDSAGLYVDLVTKQLTDETTAVTTTFTSQNSINPLTLDTFSTDVTFARGTNTITAAAAGALSTLSAGAQFTVAGTVSNDGTYTVESNDGTNLVIKSKRLTNSGSSGVATPTSPIAGPNLAFVDGGAGADTITAPINTFQDASGNPYPVGTKIRISGTGGANDGQVYTIASVSADRSTATLQTSDNVTAAPALGGTITTVPEYFYHEDTATGLTFNDNTPAADTIVAPAGTFVDASGAALPAGTRLTISGATAAANDGTYTIASVSADKSTVTLISTDTLDNATSGVASTGTMVTTKSAGTIANSSYYQGDTINRGHRISSTRSFDLDLTALDPAFEKAIRAMKLIAQGSYDSEGGLDNNSERVSQAQYLLTSSLKKTVAGTPPFGAEQISNFEQVQTDIAFDRVLIKTTETVHTKYIGFLQTSISGIERADKLEFAARLLDDQRSLEASYQIFSKVRQLSLMNFL